MRLEIVRGCVAAGEAHLRKLKLLIRERLKSCTLGSWLVGKDMKPERADGLAETGGTKRVEVSLRSACW